MSGAMRRAMLARPAVARTERLHLLRASVSSPMFSVRSRRLPSSSSHAAFFSSLVHNHNSDDDKNSTPSSRGDKKDSTTVAKPDESKLSEVKRLLALYQPEKKPLMVSMAALTVSTGVTMAVPFGMGRIIDVVTAADAAVQLPTVAGALAGLFTLGAITNVIRVDVTNMIGERITNRLRQDTYASIMSQDLGFFDASRTGELVNRLSADTSLIGKVLSDNVAGGLRSTGQAIGSITMLFVTCPKLGLVMVSIVPPIALGAVSYGRFVKKLSTQVQTTLSEATEIAEEKLANIRVVRWFAKEEHEIQVHKDKVDQVLGLARKRSLASATFFGGVDFSVKMSMLAVLGYGGQMVADGVLTSGELTSFLLYTLYVGFSSAGLSSFYSDLMKGLGASTRIFELLAREPKVLSRANWASLPVPFQGRIQFEDVHFRYPTRPDSEIFRGLNLDVKPNETIALVGPSGCGKSSVIGLLARFYELDGDGSSGRILIDGVDIATLNPTELRGIIGAVSQEPPLFACSIRDNIAYGCQHEATMEEIVEAAKTANAHDFIMSFPEGYDTVVGERGQALSGGQKQRVAIARALIKKPKLLILDEATSALDPESESLVQSAIDRAKKDRTVILVAHRLSTIKSADRIAVIFDGHVAEQGTFAELSKNSDGLFSQVVLQGQH